MISRGRMLELISTSWPNGQLIPWPSALIGGPAQDEAGGPPSRSPIKRRWRLAAHDTRFTAVTSPPQDPNPIREGGLQRREAPPALPLHRDDTTASPLHRPSLPLSGSSARNARWQAARAPLEKVFIPLSSLLVYVIVVDLGFPCTLNRGRWMKSTRSIPSVVLKF